MTRKEWNGQVKELKNRMGANPLSSNYSGDVDFNIQLGLDGRGPLANHPEIVSLRMAEPQESYIKDYSGDLPDFDRDTSTNGVE